MDDYKYMPLYKLIKNVSQTFCVDSLNEIISSRKVFVFEGMRFILPEYLLLLRQHEFSPFVQIWKIESKIDEKLDMTYDRTLQKFSQLKIQDKVNLGGPYCDYQYQELHKKIDLILSRVDIPQELHIESKIEKLFRNMVIRHLRYSWLEVCRQLNHSYNRYRWELENETIELMKPQWLKGNEFRKWLEINISTENALDREDIQKRIYNWFGNLSDTRLDDESEFINRVPVYDDPADTITKEYLTEKFFTKIALEKSTNCHLLRPSIRDLGEDTVYQLVSKVLSSFEENELNDADIAEEFGLSKATYSRFAGKEWKRDGIFEIPDLWKNVAKVVTSDPVLEEVATENGVINIIESVLTTKEEA